MGLRLVLHIMAGTVDNENARGSTEKLCQTSPLARRLHAAHLNQIEGFPWFAAGVLASIQAGVDVGVVTDHCIVYVAARVLYLVISIVQVNSMISNLRTLAWFPCIVSSAKLLLLAAQARFRRNRNSGLAME